MKICGSSGCRVRRLENTNTARNILTDRRLTDTAHLLVSATTILLRAAVESGQSPLGPVEPRSNITY